MKVMRIKNSKLISETLIIAFALFLSLLLGLHPFAYLKSLVVSYLLFCPAPYPCHLVLFDCQALLYLCFPFFLKYSPSFSLTRPFVYLVLIIELSSQNTKGMRA